MKADVLGFYTNASSVNEPWAFTVVASTNKDHEGDIAIIDELSPDIDDDIVQ